MTTKIKQELQNLLQEASTELQYADKLAQMELEIPPSFVFHIVAQLQLALRHPENKGPKAEIAESIGRQLQSKFREESATYQLLEMGWNPELDVRKSDFADDSSSDYEPVTGDNEPLVAEDITARTPQEIHEQFQSLSQLLGQAIVETLNESDPDVNWEVVTLQELENEERQES